MITAYGITQNRYFSFDMAFGEAGFAISSPLAKVLAKVFDSCVERYPHLYGSDSRVYSCLAELGVGLTREPGFHQVKIDKCDVRGNIFGLLTSHPTTPLVSIHHLDHMDPNFLNMTTIKALERLFEAANIDTGRLLQQTVCYDRWFSWTISVSWVYAVQAYGKHMHLLDILPVQETFKQWKKCWQGLIILTRVIHSDPCQRPTIFYLDSASSGRDGIRTHYKKWYQNCTNSMGSQRKLEEIRVLSQKLDLNIKQELLPIICLIFSAKVVRIQIKVIVVSLFVLS
ncbi:uncharacterized protein LOC18053204 [Citrus clementina]|uniref:uncharacterized protein LOC18053204 n=1 Tax=Citrus clementina TaxID=85681 RepID=UPI0007635530|nr:uncharacterized protein LOC18053204 [Citrus x clementina]